MNEFTKLVKAKGWKMQDVAERWGVTPRRMSQIAKEPGQKDWDAVAGLPDQTQCP
jgi:hypothetical protein